MVYCADTLLYCATQEIYITYLIGFEDMGFEEMPQVVEVFLKERTSIRHGVTNLDSTIRSLLPKGNAAELCLRGDYHLL
ncbi:unnamed protein product [Echinostoma caproni]|uniref:Reverse transcriptase Ty1/copia-type domain-containing protein n=1 Tax=Echinostoma caproni TaxID=27848 RepID=A0A183BCV6_9TREM|nr:unnamed protein product [Echinostoma caproni]